MNAVRYLPQPPRDEGLDSVDATGVQTGNADLEGSCTWKPPQGEPERAPLPGHEHQLDPSSKVCPWLTENRTFALCAVLTLVGVVMGWPL